MTDKSLQLPVFSLPAGSVEAYIQRVNQIPMLTLEEEQEGVTKENVALVPLATPLLAGPGAITAVLVWRQNTGDPMSMFLLLAAIMVTCLIVYCAFHFGEWILKVMGVGGIRVVTRLMGLLLAVVAVQFMVSGFQEIR